MRALNRNSGKAAIYLLTTAALAAGCIRQSTIVSGSVSADTQLPVSPDNTLRWKRPRPSPSPSPIPAPSPSPVSHDVSIMSYGAVASATVNNISAIQNAINAAQAKGVNVYVPAGNYGYSGVIRLPGPVHLYGAGATSVLNALDPMNETIFVTGSGGSVSNLKLTIGWSDVARQDPFECQRVTLYHASNWSVDHVVIDGGSAAGIMAAGADHGAITHNLVQNTLADSIHMTEGSSFITVNNNETIHSGDDGIAVVSYQGNSTKVHDITASNNQIHDNRYGRGMTVVGGNNVTYSNNFIHDIPNWACFYIAQEPGSLGTQTATNVTMQYNTVRNCGSSVTGHGGLLIWGDSLANDTIQFISNVVDQSTNGNPTISVTGVNQNISLVDNQVLGASVSIQTPSQVVQNTAWATGRVGYSGLIGP